MLRMFTATTSVLFLLFASAFAKPDAIDTSKSLARSSQDTAKKGEPELKTIQVKKWTFSYAIDGQNLVAKVSYPTRGWVAVCFGQKRKMLGANIIIGCLSDKGVQIQNHYGVKTTEHKAKIDIGRKDMIRDGNVTQTDNVTTIYFTIPLDDGDPQDAVITPGKEMPMAFAAGDRPNLQAEHIDVTKTKLAL